MKGIVLGLMVAWPVSSLSAQYNDTTTTASGLRYVISTHGSGVRADTGKFVLLHYTGRLANGDVFDDSRKGSGGPFGFHPGRKEVIKGWDEGVPLLRVGDHATLIIPPELGYGARSNPAIPANSTLIFDVEVIDVFDRSFGDLLRQTIDKSGAAAAERLSKQLTPAQAKRYFLSESELNGLGYAYMGKKKLPEAIAVFRINTAKFPKSSNAYDSLGEAYMNAGNTRLAIANYEMSLKLDSSSVSGREALARLKSTLKK